MMINVLLVDDEPLVKASLRAMRDWEKDGYSLVHDAKNGLEALEKLKKGGVDIVLLDMHMPKCDGIEFLKKAAENKLDPVVAVLSSYDEFPMVREAFTLGACDYILKADMTPNRVLELLDRASAIVRDRKIGDAGADDEGLRQQILQDLLTTNNPASFAPILKNLGLDMTFPVLPCEYRPCLPDFHDEGNINGNHRGDIVLQYIRNILESRLTGQFVFLPGYRAVWLAYGQDDQLTDEADSVSKELSVLTGQALNITIDWAIGERVKCLEDFSITLQSLNRLFTGNSRPVRRAKKYIRKHYADLDLSLYDVALYAGVSRTHMSSLFSKENGSGFGDYLIRIRIEAAIQLLEDTQLKVYEVAETVGFRSVEHFSRTFKKETGTSPVHYRRSPFDDNHS